MRVVASAASDADMVEAKQQFASPWSDRLEGLAGRRCYQVFLRRQLYKAELEGRLFWAIHMHRHATLDAEVLDYVLSFLEEFERPVTDYIGLLQDDTRLLLCFQATLKTNDYDYKGIVEAAGESKVGMGVFWIEDIFLTENFDRWCMKILERLHESEAMTGGIVRPGYSVTRAREWQARELEVFLDRPRLFLPAAEGVNVEEVRKVRDELAKPVTVPQSDADADACNAGQNAAAARDDDNGDDGSYDVYGAVDDGDDGDDDDDNP
ncbi:hypothetical protein AK812_SmicGene17820 [Symbiodinium microadriaticum]|uniref:Uncharacterized protein n=1 Tax=Symbiodinium microadriaticum TaxID=2951 RepID=A0A1Q9DWN1_SYMMI|nr:hypothetical protein AK812_SmicGene17820 [Symbiodinium microadriaticum]